MPEQMNTGDVCRRIGVPVTAQLLKDLGFVPAGSDKRAVFWNPDDYPEMCVKVGDWIKGRKDVPMQPRPDPKPKAGAAQPPLDDDDEL